MTDRAEHRDAYEAAHDRLAEAYKFRSTVGSSRTSSTSTTSPAWGKQGLRRYQKRRFKFRSGRGAKGVTRSSFRKWKVSRHPTSKWSRRANKQFSKPVKLPKKRKLAFSGGISPFRHRSSFGEASQAQKAAYIRESIDSRARWGKPIPGPKSNIPKPVRKRLKGYGYRWNPRRGSFMRPKADYPTIKQLPGRPGGEGSRIT